MATCGLSYICSTISVKCWVLCDMETKEVSGWFELSCSVKSMSCLRSYDGKCVNSVVILSQKLNDGPWLRSGRKRRLFTRWYLTGL